MPNSSIPVSDIVFNDLHSHVQKTQSTPAFCEHTSFPDNDKLMQHILNQSGEAIIICNSSLTVMRANKKAALLCNMNPVSKHFDNIFPLKKTPSGPAHENNTNDSKNLFHLETALKNSEKPESEVYLTGRDAKNKYFRININPLPDKNSATSGYVITMTDITALKTAEDELKQTSLKTIEHNSIIIQQEREKVMLQMAGTTAHELNQPLMALMGHIELINLQNDPPEEIQERLSRIYESAERISGIVKKIQNLRHYDTITYSDNFSIINLNQKIKMLVFDKHGNHFKQIKKNFTKQYENIEIVHTTNLRTTISCIENNLFDFIFFHFNRFTDNGFFDLRQLKNKAPDIPILVTADQKDENLVSRVIHAGADDYISNDMINGSELEKFTTNILERIRITREVNKTKNKINSMMSRDSLTGLRNHPIFYEILEQKLSGANQFEMDLFLCLVRIDDLEKIYSTHGYPARDMVISVTGRLLTGSLQRSDQLFRIGTNEFAIIITDTRPEKSFRNFSNFVKKATKYNFRYNKSKFRITPAIGVAGFSRTSKKTAEDLIAAAKKAIDSIGLKDRKRVAGYRETQNDSIPKLGDILVRLNLVSNDQLNDGLTEQNMKFGEILLQAGRIEMAQLRHAIGRQKYISEKIGIILKKLGYISECDIKWTIARMRRKIGEILVENGFISIAELQRALVLQKHI